MHGSIDPSREHIPASVQRGRYQGLQQDRMDFVSFALKAEREDVLFGGRGYA